jgi:acyl-CoA synthetase (AMP-forming)/AMP-acid ligase II
LTPKARPALPTLPGYIEHYAASAPGRPALRTDAGPVSYRTLADAVDRTARALLAAGVAPGDRVGMLSTPRPAFVVSYLAATKIGAIWFGLNPRYTVPEIGYVLGDAEPRLVLSVEEFEGRRLADDLRHAARDTGQAHDLHVLGSADPLLAVDAELDAAGAGIDPAAVAQRAAAVDPQDVALLVYTSGSTGRPKGALLRHSGLVRLGRVQTAAYRVAEARTIGDGPINHVGMPGDILAMVAVSGGFPAPARAVRRRRHARGNSARAGQHDHDRHHAAPADHRPPRFRAHGPRVAAGGGLGRRGASAVLDPAAARPRACPDHDLRKQRGDLVGDLRRL